MDQGELNGKVQAFADLLHEQQLAAYLKQYPNSTLAETNTQVFVRPRQKYIAVDVDTSGKYLVVRETGEIFGIKGYGVLHRGHRYGTLDTIHDWDWSGYVGRRKSGS